MGDESHKPEQLPPSVQPQPAEARGQWRWAPHLFFYEVLDVHSDQLQIWCYTDHLSYAPGDTIAFHVSTNAEHYDLEILRDGATPQAVHTSRDLPGALHGVPERCYRDGCGWPVAFELTVPEAWSSGGYLAIVRARRGDVVVEQQHVFVIKPPPQSDADLLLVTASSTWIAYNDWGGSNYYEGIDGASGEEFSPVLSIERPWSRGLAWVPAGAPRIPYSTAPRPGDVPSYGAFDWAYANGFAKYYAAAGWASYERQFVEWAERSGYRFDVITQHDLHYEPERLRNYRCMVTVGHDEYWSWEMRDAVDAFVDGGGCLARLGANFLWQVRLEDHGRRQVCYKYRAHREDPVRDSESSERLTTTWEAAEVARPGAATMGLSGAYGVYSRVGGMTPRSSGGYTVYRPGHWVFEGTDLYYGDVFGAEVNLLAYEVDGVRYTFRNGLPYPTFEDGAPETLEILAMAPATLREEHHGNPGTLLYVGDADTAFSAELFHGQVDAESLDKVARGAGMLAVFTRGAGTVFNAGSCEWVAGLNARDPYADRITRNVLDRFCGPDPRVSEARRGS